MNLHGIASPYISSVNPFTSVSLQISTGSTVRADFVPVPAYAAPVTVLGQIQPISTRDLAQLEGINLGGVKWKIYLNGAINGIVRPEKLGGDLVTITTGQHQGVWLVVAVLEAWKNWAVAAIVQQNGS
jgi:hypothetical protein